MKKRFFSLALAVLLLLLLLPLQTFAADPPAEAAYHTALRNLQRRTSGQAKGLFLDLDGDDTPELLLAYLYTDGERGTALLALRAGRPEYLVRAAYPRNDISYFADGYGSISAVDYGGERLVMTLKTARFAAEYDADYGQLYWDQGDFCLYRYAGGKANALEHWEYRFLETEDGRYFEGEGYIRCNGEKTSVDTLNAAMERITILQTVSLYTDEDDGFALDRLIRVTEGGFVDVPDGEYYAKPVDWAVSQGITNGTGAYAFSPEMPCTRAQVVTFLWRAAGSPEPTSAGHPFTDINPNDYFYEAVLWAVEQGITNGMDATHFGPETPCTRAHVVTFLWRAEGKPAAGSANPFSDVPADEYYTDAVLWAVKHEITNGTGEGRFSPDLTCTRGQIVTFLYRALADQTAPTPPPVGDLRMACGSDCGVMNFDYGQSLAGWISTNSDTFVEAVDSAGSEANLAALRSGEAQLCLCRSDVASYAFSGMRMYADAGAYQDFSVLAALYLDLVCFITTDKNIRTIEDLRGKAVAVGEKGSAAYFNAMDILGVYGMTEADVTPVYLDPYDAVAAMKEGEVDSACVLLNRSFWSSAKLTQLAYHTVEMDEAHIDALTASSPFYAKRPSLEIQGMGLPDASFTVFTRKLLLARNDVADADVRNLLSALFNEQAIAQMAWTFAEGGQFSLPGFANAVTDIPYHPAAAAFFAEQGGGQAP